MHILVTGGCGYLGSVLVQRLLKRQYRVRVLDTLLHGILPVWPLVGQGRLEFLRGDIRDPAAVQSAVRGTDAIVHLAAIVGDPACSQKPAFAREVNLDGSRVLVAAAKKEKVKRFLFASTCSNYGKLPESSKLADEDFPLRPLSLYAETKVEIEKQLLGEDVDVLEPTVLRFSTLYGLSPRMRFDLTVNEFVRTLKLSRRLVVYGEQFWRPYVHVSDAARAIEMVLAADRSVVAHRVFNVGDSAENYRKVDLVDIITSRLPDSHIEFVHKTEDPRDYKVSCDRIASALGYRITRTVPDGVDEIIQAIDAGLLDESDNAATPPVTLEQAATA